jgi:signal transduction histidine kinase/tetratricopeptide (TPR) repeat protein
LDEVYQESEKSLDFARKVKYEWVSDSIIAMQRLIRNLQGLASSFPSFINENDGEAFEEKLVKHKIRLVACWYYIIKLQAKFWFGDYEEALAAASKAEPLLWTSRTVIQLVDYYYYCALALSSHYYQVSPDKQTEYLSTINSYRAQFKEWSDNCPENFLHGYLLISAEIARIKGDYLEAMRLYDQAIASAGENGFLQNEGICNELAGRFYLGHGLETVAKAYMREARYCYQRWRADGKVRQLDELYPQLLEQAPPVTAPGVSIGEVQLDALAVARASQAISSEIDLARLLDALMKTVMEQAGAEKGYLLLAHDGEFSVDVEAGVETGEIKVTLHDPPVSISALPESIINYVTRTKERVLLDDATSPNPFSEDSYVIRNQPKSVLSIPIVRQAQLIGIVYLENNLLSSAFTQDRVIILELLSSQAAISLQNAIEYTKRRQAEEALRELAQNLERRVMERTAQLEAANRELEAFSYSVSHDLRAPLRAIEGFSQAVVEDYSDRLDVEGMDYLRRLQTQAQRMGRLIDDLLSLSRVTRTEMSRSTVNLSSMAEEIMDNLKRSQPEREVEVFIQPRISAYGDPGLLRIVMDNLLGNAWKFTGKKSIGRIEFGVTQKDGESVYYVKDNGAGFDMGYADKLFTPFQRLHPPEEYPGTGIGLAIVQRIIHRHGGRVWAEGKVDEGAVFYFTLPGEKA